jgi:glycosyltransferase involved in cell wall biosynthesis
VLRVASAAPAEAPTLVQLGTAPRQRGGLPRLLFASYHAYLDHSGGAALATRDLFEELAGHGWDCRVVCGPRLDYADGRTPQRVLQELGIGYHREQCAPPGGSSYELFHFTLGGVPVTQYRPNGDDPRRPPPREQGIPFLDVVERACAKFGTDLVLTYGGPPVGPHLIRRARRQGARVVFTLHNFAYQDRDLFREVDGVWAPSEFARRAYLERIGVEAEAIPWPWNRARAIADRIEGRFATFVNPAPEKGVTWLARIVLEMARRRLEIPFLAVEGRNGPAWRRHLPVDLSGVANLRGMHSTPQPRQFYAQSRLVLMPSLWEESFGRVAAEALANGIPVLASNRGALPETLADAGFLFDIPARYTPGFMELPTAAEVGPWIETIERLWDDEEFFQLHCHRALERAPSPPAPTTSTSVRPTGPG